MVHLLSPYYDSIATACLLFPIIALLFTVPFATFNYRKFGGISVARVIVVYSFILYLMCVFLLTVLPLPSFEYVAAMPAHKIGWIPFHDMAVGLQEAGLSLSDPSTLTNLGAWRSFLAGGDLFQFLANVAMMIPLGFYLRYYFCLSWRKTLLVGLGVSLFLELTQLSGLYGIYPKAYRFTEMDDLIANTLGAGVGYALMPFASRFLPTREAMDLISYRKGERVTVARKAFAFVLDAVIFCVAAGVLMVMPLGAALPFALIAVLVLLFCVVPVRTKGMTFGQKLLKLRTVDADGVSDAATGQIITRSVLLYLVEPMTLFISGCFLVVFLVALSQMGDVVAMQAYLALIAAVGMAVPAVVFSLVMRSMVRWRAMPHSHLSETKVISTQVDNIVYLRSDFVSSEPLRHSAPLTPQ